MDKKLKHKISTYLATNGHFRDSGIYPIVDEQFTYLDAGLSPPLYWGANPFAKDPHDDFGYSCDPMRDSVKAMADRIIIW
jgi:hypothetical protein